MAEYITHSRAETVALGKRMAAVLPPVQEDPEAYREVQGS